MQDKAKRAERSNLIKGATGDWEVVVGMEVHAQVNSKSKLFSGASTEFGAEPNAQVSLIDAAMPGMLPVINGECVAQAVRTGLGLKARINLRSVFDRKNYFYPDLPQGYQISQYKQPIVGEGVVEVDADGETFTVGIERLHLEQDAGKSIHDRHPEYSYVDLNRAGVALMEIVSKPDIRSARQAQAFLSKVRTILRYLGTSDGDMEKGNLRADVNVSVRRAGETKFGTRCEIKNLNSIRFIGQAIEAEARRQIDIIEDGGTIEQETRLFDSAKGETRSMRSKEEAHDYRYFPDPDLLPLELTQDYVDGLKKGLPELPDEKKARFIREYGLSAYDAGVLVAERESADYFEAVARGRDGKTAANWVINELFGRLNKEGKDIEHSPVSSGQLGAILDLIVSGAISGKIAKDLFEIVWSEGGDPAEIVEKRGMRQVTDTGAIEAAVDAVIAANPDKVAQAKAKPAALGWFVGQVMKATGGKANPQAVNELLRKKIRIQEQDILVKDREKTRKVLFDNRRRTRPQPLRPGENLFDYYDECGRIGYDEFRSILNHWVSEVPADHRAELISRMRNAGNSAFGAALSELVTHALLLRLNYGVSVHPEVFGTRRRPDFAATDGKGKILCFVEVTTVNRADQEDGELGREAPIYRAINRANLPPGCLLGYHLIQAGSESPPVGPLVKSIERWAKDNAVYAQTSEVVQRFSVGGWIIELDLFSGGDAQSGTEAIGVVTMRGGVIAPHKDIRGALEEKSRRYGAMDAPYVIVVADGKEQLFNEKRVREAITEAVFGDERMVFVGGKGKSEYANNGLWFGPNGPRNRHVSGVLLLPKTGIWELREQKWQPILAVNPWSTFPLPDPIRRLNRLEADGDRWVQRDGMVFADILGLPMPWPPVES